MKARSVLIVDDDAVMRVSLKTTIDWESHGFFLAGEAQNGREALQLAEHIQPDIVITDMKMPIMDGVALIRSLNEQDKKPQILVLSGYDDYELVREAMKLGAVDYLLKLDVTEDTLLQALQPQVVQQKVRTIPMQREQILQKILHKDFPSEDALLQQMHQAELSFSAQKIWCIAMKNFALMDSESDEETYHTQKMSVIGITEEILCERMDAYCLEDHKGEFFILAAFRDTQQENSDMPFRLIQRLHDMLEEYLDLSFFIGVSSGSCDCDSLYRACRQANLAARSCMLNGKDILFWRQEQYLYDQTEKYDAYHCQKQIKISLSARDAQLASDALKQVGKDAKSNAFSRLTWLQTAMDLSVSLRNGLRECGADYADVFRESSVQMEDLLKLYTLDDFLRWLSHLEHDICTFIEGMQSENWKEVRLAQEFIDRHYAEEISLSDVADMLHLTAGYISSMMKRQLGMSFLEYLIHVRMTKAKELLEQSNIRVYEVAECVGYSNPFYFGRLFKREVGISPGQYRHNTQNKGDVT